jgi:hypothetical protein
MNAVHFDLTTGPYTVIHATNNGTRTLCGRKIDHRTGTPRDHDDQAITWEQALRDILDTCKACRRSSARAERLMTGCRK